MCTQYEYIESGETEIEREKTSQEKEPQKRFLFFPFETNIYDFNVFVHMESDVRGFCFATYIL